MKNQFNSNIVTSQLDKKNKTSKNILTIVMLACLSLFSLSSLQAQDNGNTNDTQASTAEKTILVKGTVTDETGPLPGVNILLKGTQVGVATDFDGKFVFPQKLAKGDVLIFSYVGLKSQRIVINDETSAANVSLEVDMIESEIVIIGAVANKKVYSSKKN